MRASDAIDWLCPMVARKLTSSAEGCELEVVATEGDGSSQAIKAKLVVLADGGRSPCQPVLALRVILPITGRRRLLPISAPPNIIIMSPMNASPMKPPMALLPYNGDCALV